MTISFAARLIRRFLIWIVVMTLFAVTASIAYYNSHSPYEASADILLKPSPASFQTGYAPSPERFVQTQAERAMSDAVLDGAVRRLGGGVTGDDLRQTVSVGGGGTSDIVRFTVSTMSAEASAQRLTAWAESYIEIVEPDLDASVLRFIPASRVTSAGRAGLLGMVGGLVGATLLILVWGALRRPVLSPSDTVLSHAGLRVYPVEVPRLDGTVVMDQFITRLHDWLAEATGSPESQLVIRGYDVGRGTSAARLVDALNRAGGDVAVADGGAVRSGARGEAVALVVAERGRTNEQQIQETAFSVSPNLARTVVVVVDADGRLAKGRATAPSKN